MKTFFALIAAAVMAATAPATQAASLVWDPPANAATAVLAGYKVYVTDMETPKATLGPDEQAYPLENMVVGQEYLVGVRAYNSAGESAMVKLQFTYQEDMLLVIPAAPSKLVIQFSTPGGN